MLYIIVVWCADVDTNKNTAHFRKYRTRVRTQSGRCMESKECIGVDIPYCRHLFNAVQHCRFA